METLEYIKKTLVDIHSTCTTDKYGQVGRTTFSRGIFGEREEEVNEWMETNPDVLRLVYHTNRYFSYYAYEILDDDIKKACREALRENENYLRNVNNW